MASWGSQRKLKIISGIIGTLLVVVGIPTFLIVYDRPTCFDGLKNQDERGIDCGGKCVKLCAADFLGLIEHWERFSKVTNGVYTTAAYIENPNLGHFARSVPYLFKLYDNEGVLITERRGTTYVPAGKFFAVFEGGIQTFERIPARVTFEFTAFPNWQKADEVPPVFNVTNKILENEETSPKVYATIANPHIRDYSSVEVVAILYDLRDNAIGFSKTVIDVLRGDAEEPVFFTWPQSFQAPVSKIDIVTKVDSKK